MTVKRGERFTRFVPSIYKRKNRQHVVALTEKKGDFDNQTSELYLRRASWRQVVKGRTGEAVVIVVVVVGDDELWVFRLL